MISKSQIKLITSLGIKKFRDREGMFVAEGEKLVRDLEPYFEKVLEISDNEDIRKVSQMTTPAGRIAVFRKREMAAEEGDNLMLALDSVQDPGNMGTIIRTADWFGVRNILCSRETADVYGPKVVQSTMGAIARVNVIYCDLEETLREYGKRGWSVYGTFLEGRSIYESKLPTSKAIVVMGNEGNGISDKIKQLVTDKLLIPSFAEETSESLNVGIATGIVLSEFRRNYR